MSQVEHSTRELRCPKCDSERIETERRLNGDHVCKACRHKWPQSAASRHQDQVDAVPVSGAKVHLVMLARDEAVQAGENEIARIQGETDTRMPDRRTVRDVLHDTFGAGYRAAIADAKAMLERGPELT